ncbi:polysaccharide export protein [Pontibacter sp. BT310]|uniref:Polysaccharide export protein n=1 Tax=Pontibacter populi TaxID=890055 RepID=A0ABS6XDM4_9BACT|nr:MULTISPECIES: polysaccharide biosynthesis/export family protein [Pontibacter]MBJ6119127.1 polysaccharide export protein [Pontibacter sp. BT310]MBR0571555.1 polysaccharide export protein [Microvirga sp. STS03]MBW3365981.1 polysaccharide export protein [Pontibacter populi]
MRNLLYFLSFLVLVSSCMTKKELVYMQNPNYKETTPTTHATSYSVYKLQPNDVLSIKVLSVDPDMADMFNIVNPTNAFGMSDPGSMYLSGYTLDNEGNVNLPTVGKLKMEGLTTSQAQDLIQRNLNRYITDATVVVKLISFKISVLGDVKAPGRYHIYNDRANLLEGLSMAGDLTQGASRQNVKLIRQKGDQSEVVLLDLTDPNLVQSQYYYLMPNDVIYVEPRKTQLSRENLVVVGVMLSIISTGVLLLNYLK